MSYFRNSNCFLLLVHVEVKVYVSQLIASLNTGFI